MRRRDVRQRIGPADLDLDLARLDDREQLAAHLRHGGDARLMGAERRTRDVDRALAHQDTMDREGFQQVVRMLHWQLNEMLKNEGLSVVPTVGEPFDPYVHEAIEQVVSDAYGEGTVVEEVRKGYKQGDDTLRPARVKVSSGSGA